MKTAWLGLGGNVGDVGGNMILALEALSSPSTSIVAVSALYETPPWGPVEQPAFMNACAAIRTRLKPPELLARLHEIETELRRERVVRWGPRTIDLDLLAFEGFRSKDPALVVPHPRIAERAFVLVPLADIAPDLVLDGGTVADLAAASTEAGIRRIAEDWYPNVSVS